ncbi:MAG: hypothetical protein AAB225_22360 [Acidobacteriota bacterium]
MGTTVVFLAYGCALVLALVLLYFVHARWYFHVLSIALALAVGLWPPPEGLAGRPLFDLLVGCLFVFLLIWGIGAPFFRPMHRRRSR